MELDDAFFRQIVDGMRNGVLAVRRDGSLALMNDEARRILAIPPSVATGAAVSTALRHQPEVARVLACVFDIHHLPSRAELRLGRQGIVIGYTMSLVRDDRGALIGAAMFFKDLTRVEQLQERERLRERLATVGEMAAMIAHEVKNPLGGIEVMAGLLRRKVEGVPDAQAMLSEIIAEAKMANRIVQEVLDFSRPSTLRLGPASVSEAIHAAVHLADSKGRRGVQVTFDIDPALPAVHADQQQITQVVTNVLINAYEAMNGMGQVRVRATRATIDDGYRTRAAVLVEISDNGPGLPPDVEHKVFEPFFTTKPQGSGLGLAIVRKIIDAHDGRLDIASTPGRGTTVGITLPAQVAAR